MGSSYGGKHSRLYGLMKHVAYKDLVPYKDETLLRFTLRFVANLISPPQQEQESMEIECKELSSAITDMALHDKIFCIWMAEQYK